MHDDTMKDVFTWTKDAGLLEAKRDRIADLIGKYRPIIGEATRKNGELENR